ncbi:hypothetical protein A6X21_01385 [Planctopirus hydrillae]|uniref:Uncharacterized protein n=1 Tax=Planctopirus hydrillae TaxID=1841610 RepID=A0A1C3E544_9PLAN|nr:hypothetical protein A6X21_01385 [Planctopirus hydrillae]
MLGSVVAGSIHRTNDQSTVLAIVLPASPFACLASIFPASPFVVVSSPDPATDVFSCHLLNWSMKLMPRGSCWLNTG